MKIFADADLSVMDLGDLLSIADNKTVAVAVARQAQPSSSIAIIGMAGKIASCSDLDAFWELLCDGRMTRRRLPDARMADLEEFLRLKGAQHSQKPVHYFKESFLSEIDKFDHRFFGMAKQEANLADPNQRMFLETAFSALEHAGYGGGSAKGTSTGVYVGYSSDFGDAYKEIVRTLAPDAPEVAVVGNVKSIIAARIAYHLDLHGPSMMIDTACSSGLVALHQACRALQNGDCEMALAGAVKIDLIPVADDPETKLGIKDINATMASDGRTKTFDEDGEGTAGAEGVIAFLLKPLDRALADGDTVHAVILGSAINQDGQSVGITAPNLAAQEDLIVRALKDACVHPETISYIEAHGTATRLGDPVEVSGIQRAYRHFTHRRQFCAIGSVKTNIGHMDNGAGLAGLAKVVLAMKHRTLPASLNFQKPNRNILFQQSPVFVNDVLRPWQIVDGVPLRAGINSFGLSGTNCHVIVEEAPPLAVRKYASGPYLLAISADNEHALDLLLAAYHSHLQSFKGDLQDLCFTAALGRGHYQHRAALCFNDFSQLKSLLEMIVQGHPRAEISDAAFGSFRIVDDKRLHGREDGQISDSDKKSLDRRAEDWIISYRRADAVARAELLRHAQSLYVQGADFNWDELFHEQDCNRIPLPTYPFTATRCWVEVSEMGERSAGRATAKQISHPLLDRCAANSHRFRLYEVMLGVDSHWELGQHKVKGMYVLPGTAFVEMILEISAQLNKGQLLPLQVEQLVFLRPFILAEHQRKPVQLMVNEQDHDYKVQIVSQSEYATESGAPQWDVHAEATLRAGKAPAPQVVDVEQLKKALTERMSYTSSEDSSRGLEIGDRWNLSVQQGWTRPEHDEVLVHLALADIYHAENTLYHFHPALLDTAVNSANHLLGDGLYLPFSYKKLDVFKRLPSDFYVHLRKKNGSSIEACHFDIDIFDLQGQMCAQVSDYTVKRVPDTELVGDKLESHMHYVRMTAALPALLDARESVVPDAPILLVRDGEQESLQLAARLRSTGVQVIELVRGKQDTGYDVALASVAKQTDTRLAGVVYTMGLRGVQISGELVPELNPQPSEAADDFFEFITSFTRHKLRCSGAILVLSSGAFVVDDHALHVMPDAAALAALARVTRMENPQLKLRCLDSDVLPDITLLMRELGDKQELDLAVYRQGVRYHERLVSVVRHESSNFTPRPEGIYVLTGGLGALGLELAGLLMRKGPVNLALLSSTGLPQRNEWEDIVNNREDPEKTRHIITRVLALEKAGSRIEIIAADIGDFAHMQDVLEKLRADYGRINGVVHAAGRAGEGFLHNKSREVFARVLRPKVDGAWVLHTLTLADPLDFFVMYSSVATVLRSPGQTDYTAANAYLDALAHYRRSQGLTAISICWPAWREVGIAVEYGAVDEEEFFAPINNAEALQLLEQVLCDGGELPPVLMLSEINQRATLAQVDALRLELPDALRSRLQRGIARRRSNVSGSSIKGDSVQLSGIDVADDVALSVAQIWSRILGVSELGADETFADFGGNSILTTQLYTEFEKRYPGAVDVVDLFTYTTIREQSIFIRKALGVHLAQLNNAVSPTTKDEEYAEMDRILAMLAEGNISADEAQSLLT